MAGAFLQEDVIRPSKDPKVGETPEALSLRFNCKCWFYAGPPKAHKLRSRAVEVNHLLKKEVKRRWAASNPRCTICVPFARGKLLVIREPSGGE